MKIDLKNKKRDEIVKALQECAAVVRAYPASARLDVHVHIVVKKKKGA